MHSIAIISSLVTFAMLFVGGDAAPLNKRANGDLCLEGTIYYAANSCTSGFVGCASPNYYSYVCSGSRRFYSDCGPEGDLGSFFVCANGFRGCNTNPKVCDNKLALSGAPSSPSQSWSCPAGTLYYGEGSCSSGFVGCLSQGNLLCSGSKRFDAGSCPAGSGNFFRCANGFVGCSTNWNMC